MNEHLVANESWRCYVVQPSSSTRLMQWLVDSCAVCKGLIWAQMFALKLQWSESCASLPSHDQQAVQLAFGVKRHGANRWQVKWHMCWGSITCCLKLTLLVLLTLLLVVATCLPRSGNFSPTHCYIRLSRSSGSLSCTSDTISVGLTP